MKKLIYIMTAAVLLLACCGGNDSRGTEHAAAKEAVETDMAGGLTVGFSQMNHINPWRVEETNDLKRRALELGVKLLVTDAESSQERQIADIRSLISRGADYIVCAPLIYSGWEEAFEACRTAGVPLIMLDREAEGTAGKDFLTFVGGDFEHEGKMAAEWLVNESGKSARIIEIRGREGASCTFDRERGFREVITGYPDMEIVHFDYADFERIKGQRVMEDIILSFGSDFNAVYAHNDEMAIGAIQALKAADIQPGRDVIVVSVDGSRDALKSIIAGELGATVECTPRLAEQVFQAIFRHEMGKEVPAKIIVEERLFDKSNALEHIDDAF